MGVVIQVPCIVSWTSIFTSHMILILDFFICWLEWFSTDQAVGGIVVFTPLLLGQSFNRDIISYVLSTDGCRSKDLLQKLFSIVIPYIYLGWFKVLPITAFHVDAASAWYVMLVLRDERFWWQWFTRVLFG